MSSWRGSYGHGGSQANRRPKHQQAKATPPPPLGDLVERINNIGVPESTSSTKKYYGIQGTEVIASYNWADQATPKIIVPGKPPLWSPLVGPQQMREDDGIYFRDQNAALYPKHPLQPAILAVLKMHPIPFDIDIVACGSTLGNLLRFVRGEDRQFRMLVEVVGQTVHLIRRENSPREQILDVKGYGHTFPEAYTIWERDVGSSNSHQRILKYQFGGLNFLLRFEGDGYVQGQTPQSAAIGTESRDALDGLGQLQLGSLAMGQFGNSDGLVVADGGQVIDQESIFDLKTRSIRTKELDTLGDQLPRLWVAQIHKFILAFHQHGLFKDVEVQDVWDEVLEWEKKNQASLRQLASLLHGIRLRALAMAQDDKLEIVRPEGGPLEIRRRLPDAGDVFSADVRQQWWEWLEEYRGAAFPDDEDDDDDDDEEGGGGGGEGEEEKEEEDNDDDDVYNDAQG